MKIKKNLLIYLSLVSTILFFIPPLAGAGQEFEQWKQGEIGAFGDYKDARDSEFVSFLKKQWEEFNTSKGIVRDKTPKPEVIPAAPVKKYPASPAPPVNKGRKIKIHVQTKQKPVPDIFLPKKTIGNEIKKEISFFGTRLVFFYDPAFEAIEIKSPNQKAIAGFWDEMSRSHYLGFLNTAKEYRKKLNLNEWGYHVLLYKAGEIIYPGDRNMALVFTWYFSLKSGYSSKIGYKGQRVHLLMPSIQKIYNTKFITLGEKRYYNIEFNGEYESFKSLRTYKGSYPRARKSMDLRISSTPELKLALETRKLNFEYRGKRYTLSVDFNKNLVDFFKYYPQTDIGIYFSTPVSNITEKSLADAIFPIIKGMSEKNAADFFLRLTQTSFKYKTDGMQFGREKYMLPEETLFYPFSDCEDRAVFFAQLVKNFIGIKILGLSFPGHIATAARFDSIVHGDQVLFQGRQYTVCDPTYINASAGMEMPKFKGIQPNIIKF